MEVSALLERWGGGYRWVPLEVVDGCHGGHKEPVINGVCALNGLKINHSAFQKLMNYLIFEISVFPIKIRDVNKVYLISAWKIIDRTLGERF